MGNCHRRQEALILSTRGTGPTGRARVIRREAEAIVNRLDGCWVRFALQLALRRISVIVVVHRVEQEEVWPEGEEEAARWSGFEDRLSLGDDY